MSYKIILFLIVLIMASDNYCQLPPNTVVFKVRKAEPTEATVTNGEGVWFVEENATFQGGDLNNFSNWVRERILYPLEAAEAGIKGKVFVQFSIDTKGNVCDVKVVRSVHPSLDNEVIRVIRSSPRWTPAKQSGIAIKQNFVIPISFSMQ